MDDLISRQAAIDELHMHLMYRMATESNKQRLDAWINNLPSAQPERKRGKWILDDEYIDCSACKREKWSRVPYERLVKQFRFCPNCGADMRGEQDG